MYWPEDTYFVPPNSKGHLNNGERKPPSLSASVQKKNEGLRDVLGITTVILSSTSSLDRASFLDVLFSLWCVLRARGNFAFNDTLAFGRRFPFGDSSAFRFRQFLHD